MGSLEESLACADAAIMVLRPGNFDLVNIMKTTGMLPDIVDDPNWKQIVPGLRNPRGAFPGQRNYPSTLISYFRILLTAVRGSVLYELGRYDEALLSYEEGLWTVDHFLESDVSHSPKARVEQERSEFLVLIKKAKARGKSDQELLIQSSMYKEDETAFIEDKEVTTNDPDSSLLNWYHQVMIPTKRAGAAYWQQIIGAPLLATKINQYLQSIHLHQAHQSPGFNCSNMFKGGYKAHGVGVSQSTLNDKWHHHWDDGEEYYTNAPFDAGCKFDRRVESEDESEEEDDSDEE
jgi:hypothetical protein